MGKQEQLPEQEQVHIPEVRSEQALSKFNVGESISDRREYNDAFKVAQENLINIRIFYKFVDAVTEKEIDGSNDTLAKLHNRIVQICLPLSEHDTEILVNQFNNNVREWFVKKYKPGKINSAVYERIARGDFTTGKSNIDVKGVLSVISFLKARSLLLEKEPANEYSFHFNGKLDSRNMIDVVEVDTDREGEVSISLIQIKSSLPSEEEAEKIHEGHKRWANNQWIDFEDYHNSYIERGTENEVAAFLENKDRVEEELFDFCTNPNGKNIEKLIDSLHLSNLDDRQKAWILWKYMDLIKEQIDVAEKNGNLDTETKVWILEELDSLKEKLVKKAKLPRSVSLIKKITSIISVGPRIVSEKEISMERSPKIINTR